MSASIREQILLALKAALEGVGSPASQVTRSRIDQLQPADLPCYDITPGQEKVDDEGGYGDQESVTRTLSVSVRAVLDAGSAEGEDADPTITPDDSALDPFYVFAIQQLVGADAWLGGLADNVSEVSTATVFRPEGRAVIGLEMQFDFIFATKRGDPTQKG